MAAGGVSLEIDTLKSDCGIHLTVSADKILSSKASAFVTGEDNELRGKGCVSQSLKQQFSYDYKLAKKKLWNDGGRKFEISGVYPCQFTWKGNSITIYHAVVPTMGMRGFNMDAWEKSMKKLYLQLFAKASLDVKELAVPVLGSGGAGAPFTEAAKTLLETFLSFKPESKHFKLKMITVYVYPETNLQPMKKLMKEAQEKFSIKTPESVQEMELAKHRTVSDASNNTLAEKNRTHSNTRSSDASLNLNSSPHSKTNGNFVDTKKPNSKALYIQDSNINAILGNLSLTEYASDASKFKKTHIKRGDCTKADSKSEDDCNGKEVSDLDGRDTHAGEDRHNVEVDTKAGNDVEENMDVESDSNEEQSPQEKEEEDKCAICLDQINNPKKLDKCGHKYCSECIEYYFQHHKPACPTCNTMYGIITGNQPKNGKMDTTLTPSIHLPGYENCGAIVIDYTFPSGIQDKDHPNPNEAYSGTHRRAYLPDCAEGRKVCDLLRVAFDKHLIFTVGSSRTTGADNVVTWNDIHHKTRIDGGPTRFGYPDPTYLSRVQEELAAKGVTEASLKSNYNHNKIVHKN